MNINVNVQFSAVVSCRHMHLSGGIFNFCLAQILASAVLSYPRFSEIFFSGASTSSSKGHIQLPFIEQIGMVVTSSLGFG
jgi:hypothetical protein